MLIVMFRFLPVFLAWFLLSASQSHSFLSSCLCYKMTDINFTAGLDLPSIAPSAHLGNKANFNLPQITDGTSGKLACILIVNNNVKHICAFSTIYSHRIRPFLLLKKWAAHRLRRMRLLLRLKPLPSKSRFIDINIIRTHLYRLNNTNPP